MKEKRPAINSGRLVGGGAAALSLLLAVAAVTAQETGPRDWNPRQLKKSLKEANSKWLGGDVEGAVELYEDVLAATESDAPERADALYALIVVSLAPDSPFRDPERLPALLSEYDRFPAHPRHLEVRTFESLMDAADRERKESRRLADDIAADREACERERLELRETSGRRSESLEAEIEDLAGKLAQAEEELALKDAELRIARAELAKKEEALEKLRQRVVGRSGG